MQHTQQGGQLSGSRHYFNPVLNKHRHKTNRKDKEYKEETKMGTQKKTDTSSQYVKLNTFQIISIFFNDHRIKITCLDLEGFKS